MDLNAVELEFVDFISARTGKSVEYIRRVYCETKTNFKFETESFKDLTLQIYNVNKLLYDEETYEDLIATYKYHELITAFRFLSYTFKKPQSTASKRKLFTLLRLLCRGRLLKIKTLIHKNISQRVNADYHDDEELSARELAQKMLSLVSGEIGQVVDYGCGPAYLSFEIANLCHQSGLAVPTTYLVDIDCLMKDFVLYRFKKYGFPVVSITVDMDNLYPTLPKHKICIATEVMEHIKEPLRAFDNIQAASQKGAILYGNFENHAPHTLHISPDLSALRSEITNAGYQKNSRLLYVRR